MIAKSRNDRIEFSNRTCDISNSLYQCVTRSEGQIQVYETEYPLINLDSIEIFQSKPAAIRFSDGSHEYIFNFSKSTLFKQFNNKDEIVFDVNIEEDPFELLFNFLGERNIHSPFPNQIDSILEEDFIILPLYSTQRKRQNLEPVPEKSQLNQWNANGRHRDYGEIYIHIPRAIHEVSPNFFPERDQPFELKVPSGEVMIAKVCQDGNKALMTNPNNALANWLLRKTLMLNEGELLTYRKLEELGIDSVIITKFGDLKYTINFSGIGRYEEFILPTHEG